MQRIKNIIKFCYSSSFYYSGLFFLWLKLRDGRKNILILNYHIIDKQGFEEHIKYLSKFYTIISLEQYCYYLQENSPINKNYVTITFDDGYKSFYSDIFPIVKKYNVPVTIFLTTRPIDNEEFLWFDLVKIAVTVCCRKEIKFGDKTFSFKNMSREEVYKQIISFLNQISIEERDQNILKLKREFPFTNKETQKYKLLTWKEIDEMKGYVNYGAHTLTHPNLCMLDENAVKNEVLYSKRRLEEKLNLNIKHFAYPFGGKSHFNELTMRVIKKNGFDCALTTIRGTSKIGDNSFALKRMLVFGDLNGPMLMTRLSGLWIFLTT